MLSLSGEPVIRHVLRRCQEIPGVDTVICTVPDHPSSKPIVREALALDCRVHRGPENDVLTRYYGAAMSVGADVVMRVTGDCPLIDPEICGRVLALLTGDIEYASNLMPRGFPDGLDCEAFTFPALSRTFLEATDTYDREHVTSWMQRNCKTANLPGGGDPDLRWTLDTLEDYLVLSELFE